MARVEGEKIEIGRILSRGFDIFRSNLLLFVGTTFVVAILPLVLIRGVNILIISNADDRPTVLPLMLFAQIMVSFTFWLAQAIIVHMVIVHYSGQKIPIKESFLRAGKLFPRIVGAMILLTFASMLGAFFLFVPGVILFIMFSVAMPVILHEGTGAIRSLGRSRELTRGSRWSIFLLFVVGGLITLVAAAPFLAAVVIAPGNVLAMLIGSMLVNLVIIPIYAVLSASLYIDLRDVREGMGAEHVAEIFA